MTRPYRVEYRVERGGRHYSGVREFRKATLARRFVDSVRRERGTATLHDAREPVFGELQELYALAAESAALWRDAQAGWVRTLCAVAETAALKRVAEIRGLRGMIEAMT